MNDSFTTRDPFAYLGDPFQEKDAFDGQITTSEDKDEEILPRTKAPRGSTGRDQQTRPRMQRMDLSQKSPTPTRKSLTSSSQTRSPDEWTSWIGTGSRSPQKSVSLPAHSTPPVRRRPTTPGKILPSPRDPESTKIKWSPPPPPPPPFSDPTSASVPSLPAGRITPISAPRSPPFTAKSRPILEPRSPLLSKKSISDSSSQSVASSIISESGSTLLSTTVSKRSTIGSTMPSPTSSRKSPLDSRLLSPTSSKKSTVDSTLQSPTSSRKSNSRKITYRSPTTSSKKSMAESTLQSPESSRKAILDSTLVSPTTSKIVTSGSTLGATVSAGNLTSPSTSSRSSVKSTSRSSSPSTTPQKMASPSVENDDSMSATKSKSITLSCSAEESTSPNNHDDVNKSDWDRRDGGAIGGRNRSRSSNHIAERVRSRSHSQRRRSTSMEAGGKSTTSPGFRRGNRLVRKKLKGTSWEDKASEIAAAFDCSTFRTPSGEDVFERNPVSTTADIHSNDNFGDFETAFPSEPKPSGSNNRRGGASLGNFLGEAQNTKSPRRGKDSITVHSAPAAGFNGEQRSLRGQNRSRSSQSVSHVDQSSQNRDAEIVVAEASTRRRRSPASPRFLSSSGKNDDAGDSRSLSPSKTKSSSSQRESRSRNNHDDMRRSNSGRRDNGALDDRNRSRSRSRSHSQRRRSTSLGTIGEGATSSGVRRGTRLDRKKLKGTSWEAKALEVAAAVDSFTFNTTPGEYAFQPDPASTTTHSPEDDNFGDFEAAFPPDPIRSNSSSNSPVGASLDNFLGDAEKMKSPRKGRGSATVNSAPPAGVFNLQRPAPGGLNRRRSCESVSHKDHRDMQNVIPEASPRRQSRRQSRRKSDISPQKPQVLKLDIAGLAKQGYLEVQDGKLRLVLDVGNGVH